MRPLDSRLVPLVTGAGLLFLSACHPETSEISEHLNQNVVDRDPAAQGARRGSEGRRPAKGSGAGVVDCGDPGAKEPGQCSAEAYSDAGVSDGHYGPGRDGGSGHGGLSERCEQLHAAVQDCHLAAGVGCPTEGEDPSNPSGDEVYHCLLQCRPHEVAFEQECAPNHGGCDQMLADVRRCFEEECVGQELGDGSSCLDSCHALEAEFQEACAAPPLEDDPCSLLHRAADACWVQGLCDEQCTAIQDVITLVCAPGTCLEGCAAPSHPPVPQHPGVDAGNTCGPACDGAHRRGRRSRRGA